MAGIEKKTKRYPSDLTDEECWAVEPFMPKAGSIGRPRQTDCGKHRTPTGIHSGYEWRMPPVHFPPLSGPAKSHGQSGLMAGATVKSTGVIATRSLPMRMATSLGSPLPAAAQITR